VTDYGGRSDQLCRKTRIEAPPKKRQGKGPDRRIRKKTIINHQISGTKKGEGGGGAAAPDRDHAQTTEHPENAVSAELI